MKTLIVPVTAEMLAAVERFQSAKLAIEKQGLTPGDIQPKRQPVGRAAIRMLRGRNQPREETAGRESKCEGHQ